VSWRRRRIGNICRFEAWNMSGEVLTYSRHFPVDGEEGDREDEHDDEDEEDDDEGDMDVDDHDP
jgi:hypothetical protein